jgi:riboflavin kinase/FMN adenylyltransferase
MEILDWEEALKNNAPPRSALTLGVFDGVHRGHRALIEKIVSRGPCPTVVSFKENPKRRLLGEAYEGDISTLDQKLRTFEELGAARTILIDFSVEFSRLKGREFIDLLDERLNLAFLALGSNFRCGYKQDTGAKSIREINLRRGIPTEVVPPVLDGEGPVSSSRIRKAILEGDIDEAARMLSRHVELDLGGLRPSPGGGGESVYDLTAARRICPAAGRYEVLIHGLFGPFPGRFEISIGHGRVFIPSLFNARGVELLKRFPTGV